MYKCGKDLWNQFIDQVFTANESAKRQRDTKPATNDTSNLDAIETQITESQLQQLSQQAQIPKPIILSRIKTPLNLIKFNRINKKKYILQKK